MALFGGNTTTTQKFEPPSFTGTAWKDFLGGTLQLASQPYQQYQGQTVAPLNDLQNTGLQMTADRAANGAPDLNAARGLVTNTVNGNFLNQSPGSQSSVTPGTNQYAGPNPYLEGVVSNTANDMTNSFRTGTAAQTDSMFARNGGFGGSAYQQLQSRNAAGLANSIGEATGKLRFQDYTAQQNLAENALNRSMDAQKFNTTTQQGAYDSERGRMVQATDQAGVLSQDDWKAAQAMTDAGNTYRSYQQQLEDAAKAEWDRQQAYPWLQQERVGDALSRTSGTNGGGGSSVANAPNTQSAGGLLGLIPLLKGLGLF